MSQEEHDDEPFMEESGVDGAEDGAAPHWAAAGDVDEDGMLAEDASLEPEDEEEAAAEAEAEELEYELPPFANKENRELMEEIRRKELALTKAESRAAEHEERVKVMREHLRNVQGEVSHTEELVEARRRELHTEEEMKSLAEREMGRIRSDLRKLGERAEELADELATVQGDMMRGKDKLDSFREKMEFKQSELEEWAEAQKQKEEDRLAVERYTRADEAKVKELNLSLEKLAESVAAKKRELEAAVTETQARQIELDKTAADFRAVHAERRELVERLSDSVAMISTRDDEIARAGEEYGVHRKRHRQRREAIDEEARVLERAEKENVEFERNIDELGRVLGRRRDDVRRAKEELDKLSDDVELQRSEVGKAAAELVKRRREVEQERTGVEESRRLLAASEARLAAAKKRKDEAVNAADRLEKEADAREVGLKEMEERLERQERLLAAAKDRLFREKERLNDMRRSEEELAAEITGAQAALRNMVHESRKLDEEATRQSELVYAAEFKIQAMERRLAQIKGDVSDEEKRRLEARIKELRVELEAAESLKKTLEQRTKAVDEDVNKARRRQQTLSEELANVQGAIAELQLQVRAGDSELQAAVKEREAVQVERDMVRLEVRRLRDALSRRSEEVVGLENKRVQLEMGMAARREAVDAHAKVQRAELKMAEEERHAVVMDLREREARVAALQRRYETVAARLRLPKDMADDPAIQDGQRPSQAYFVIKAAQRREELQRVGDELNAAVLHSEREIRALMATLTQVKARNATYRGSFRRADAGGGKEAEQVQKLVRKTDDVTDALFRRKRQLRKIETDATRATRATHEANAQTEALTEHLEKLRTTAERLQTERERQNSLANATSTALAKARALIRTARGEPADETDETPRTLEERAVRADALQASNHGVLFTLGQLAAEYPDLAPPLQAAIAEKGLHLPRRPPGVTSSSSVSIPPQRPQVAVNNIQFGE